MTRTTKTLTELENDDWGEPGFDSHLVTTCHRLRHKPLADFTIEDLRILLNQGFSTEHLVPIALDELERDPIAEGDYYPGDLLHALLTLERAYFDAHPDHAVRLRAVYVVARAALIADDYSTTTFDDAARRLWPHVLAGNNS